MKFKLFAIAMLMCSLYANAQDIYQVERVTSEDLNGTARFVGMGGAMSALGADISTVRTNPAGTGLLRHADAAVTMSLSSLSKGNTFDNVSKTRASFDQIGFVYPFKINSESSSLKFVNFGFNYQKRKNLHMLVNAEQALGGASQTWQMADMASFWGGPEKGSPLTDAGYQTYLYNKTGTQDEQGYDEYSVYNASRGSYNKAMTGSIQAYDFNASLNFEDRYFLGFTIGVYNVDINSYSEYGEVLDGAGKYTLSNDRSLSGSGVDFKFGTIIYPFSDYTFRFGLSVSTPTYYSLTENCNSLILSNIEGTDYDFRTQVGNHDYNIRTPWKFNVSAGGTISDLLALNAEYEYADYSSANVSYDDYDDWGWEGSSTKDRELNRQVGRYLNGVSTIRLGAEANVAPFTIRVGYNYVSSPMKDKAFLNQFINSASLDYSTSTSYMNLSSINRVTCGVGFSGKHFYADFAYMYQMQDGDFYAFSTQKGDDAVMNDIAPSKINLDKSKFLLTLGYLF